MSTITFPDAQTLKADILSKLYLTESDGESVYVNGSDSNGSHPMAWIMKKSLSKYDFPKLEALGWELLTAGAKSRKIQLVMTYKSAEERSA